MGHHTWSHTGPHCIQNILTVTLKATYREEGLISNGLHSLERAAGSRCIGTTPLANSNPETETTCAYSADLEKALLVSALSNPRHTLGPIQGCRHTSWYAAPQNHNYCHLHQPGSWNDLHSLHGARPPRMGMCTLLAYLYFGHFLGFGLIFNPFCPFLEMICFAVFVLDCFRRRWQLIRLSSMIACG